MYALNLPFFVGQTKTLVTELKRQIIITKSENIYNFKIRLY